jgi:hypothetical protein
MNEKGTDWWRDLVVIFVLSVWVAFFDDVGKTGGTSFGTRRKAEGFKLDMSI